jgi:hypothetical protein
MVEFFLSSQVCAELLKSIPSKAGKTKYALKVLVFVQSMWCQAKLRIYTESEAIDNAQHVYLIEFQRRCGDGLAFNNMFRAAEKYLQDHGFATEGRGRRGRDQALPSLVPPTVPPPPVQDVGPLQCMLGPVLDLMESRCLRYQAEGAAALAEIAARAAAERPEQKLVWTGELGARLEGLLDVQEIIVAYPAVKALLSLAHVHEEAREMAIDCAEKLNKLSGRSSLVRKETEQLFRYCGDEVAERRGLAAPTGLRAQTGVGFRQAMSWGGPAEGFSML